MTVDMIVKTLLEALCKITLACNNWKRIIYTHPLVFLLTMYVITISNRCVCPTGFRKIGSSGSDECEDIDECFHNPDICGEGGECRNTQGS